MIITERIWKQESDTFKKQKQLPVQSCEDPFSMSLESQEYMYTWFYKVGPFKSLCKCTQVWYYLLVRDISWFQYWWYKLGNFRILFTKLWSPIQQKRGGIYIYYKNFLPLKVTGIRLLEECIVFDLIISNKLCSFVALYRSPSQSQDDFATFSDNFEMTLDLVSKKNPFLIVVLGDFNAKLSQWHDKDSSTSEGISIENITS